MRKKAVYPGLYNEAAGPVIRCLSSNGGDNLVVYSELDAANADDVIDEQLRYFRQTGKAFEWKMYDFDSPPDLRERLIAKGFEQGEAEALMILPLRDDHELLRIGASSFVRRIAKPQEIDAVVRLENAVWQESHAELGVRLKEELAAYADQMAVFVAEENGQTVSVGWMYLHEGTSFCSLFGGATHAEFRGRGYYAALLAARARLAWERGFRTLMVDASAASRPILERKGFVFTGYSYPYYSPAP